MAGRARRGAAPVHRGRRLGAPADLGHGHRELGPHGRRPARRSTSRARATTSSRRWSPGRPQPAYHDIALKRRASTPRSPYVGRRPAAVHRVAPGVRGREQRRARSTCSCPRATSTQIPDYATRDPSNLFLGQPDGTFVGARRGGRDRHRSTAVVAPRSPTSTSDGLARPRRGQPRRAGPRLWRNVGAGTAEAPGADGRLARRPAQQPGGNRDAIGAVIETQGRRRRPAPRGDGRRRAHRRPARLDRTSGSGPRRRPRSGSRGRTARSGPG